MGKISLKDHFKELRKADLQHARELRKADSDLRRAVVNAINTATSKQEAQYDKRFEAGNEIKGAMHDAQVLQQRVQMPRSEAEVTSKAQDVKIGALQDANIARLSEGVGRLAGWGWAAAVVLLALAVFFGLQGRAAP